MLPMQFFQVVYLVISFIQSAPQNIPRNRSSPSYASPVPALNHISSTHSSLIRMRNRHIQHLHPAPSLRLPRTKLP